MDLHKSIEFYNGKIIREMGSGGTIRCNDAMARKSILYY